MKSDEEAFITAFLGTLLELNSGDDREIPDDKGIYDIAPATREKLASVCREFWNDNRERLLADSDGSRGIYGPVPQLAGTDFALSVSGSGAGFGDGDWGESSQRLHELCRDEKYWWIEMNGPYMGDDGLIYWMGAEE